MTRSATEPTYNLVTHGGSVIDGTVSPPGRLAVMAAPAPQGYKAEATLENGITLP